MLTMERTLLPGTDLTVSRLGFGTASLHHAVRSMERQSLLGVALDVGFTHFDTARMYGEGMAERELGRFLVGQRQRVMIGTQFGIPSITLLGRVPPLFYAHPALGSIGRRLVPGLWDRRSRLLTQDAAEASLARSLRALRTDWVDILFLHEPLATEAASVLRLAEWLRRQRETGRVRYLGLAGSARDCVAIAQQTNGLFDVLQVEDSLSGREADLVTESGRPLQITFGYVRQAAAEHGPLDGLGVIRDALARNRHGLVLVSSRRPERLGTLAALAESAAQPGSGS